MVDRPRGTQPRARRDRDNIRELLISSAIAEFAMCGFEGASTRSIAERISAHQPQINYHFSSKDELWRESVDVLWAEFDARIDAVTTTGGQGAADRLRAIVRFQADRPELLQILFHEVPRTTDRLDWVVRKHVQPMHLRLFNGWGYLQDIGIAAPIDPLFIQHVLIGAAGVLYVNAAAVRDIFGVDYTADDLVERHTNGLIATFLPGLKSD